MQNRPLYLNLLFKDFKPDVKAEKLILGAMEDAYVKPIDGNRDKVEDSREFILKYTDEFLNYAVDYSVYDKFQDYI